MVPGPKKPLKISWDQHRTLSRPERASYKRYGDDTKTGLISKIKSIILGGSQVYRSYPGQVYKQSTETYVHVGSILGRSRCEPGMIHGCSGMIQACSKPVLDLFKHECYNFLWIFQKNAKKQLLISLQKSIPPAAAVPIFYFRPHFLLELYPKYKQSI